MANLKENIKDPITSTLGLILVLSAVVVLFAPVFIEVKKDLTSMWYLPVGMAAVGILLIVSPDTIVRGANKGIDKYTGDKDKKDA